MKPELNWVQAYLEGKVLERSRDKITWYPISVEEPYAGDGWYYREKERDGTYHSSGNTE